MSDRAYINRGIWNDADHRNLSPQAQWLYYLLLTHPTISYAGVVDWRINRFVPFARGLTEAFIQETAVELSDGLYVVVDAATEEVLIRSWIKHDGVLKQPRLAVSMANAYTRTASNALRGVIVHEVAKQRVAHPEYKCWEDERVLDVLAQPSVSAESLPPFRPDVAPTVGGGFGGGLTPNRPPGVGVGLVSPPTPTPTPSSPTEKNSPPRSAKGTATKSAKAFDEWWAHWRKKKSIGDARKAFERAQKKIPLAELIEKTDAYWAWVDRTDTEDKYVPYPATWLNREQWADDLDDATKSFNIDTWKG